VRNNVVSVTVASQPKLRSTVPGRRVRIALDSARGKAVLIACCLVVVTPFFASAVRDQLAQNAATKQDYERAIRLQPGSADFYYRRGLQLSYEQPDWARAETNLRKAVELNPRSAPYWIALANIYELLDRPGPRAAALAEALNAEPQRPGIAWAVALYRITDGDTDAGLDLLERVIKQDSTRRTEALSLAWRSTHDLRKITGKLGDDPEIFLDLIRVLAAADAAEPAASAWRQMLALDRPFALKPALSYVDYLADRNPSEALKAWDDIAIRNDELRPYAHHDGNLLVNGGFDLDVLNAGLDWHLRLPGNGISMELDPTQFQAGRRSLLIHFPLSTLGAGQDAGVSQVVPVEPNRKYIFSGFFRGSIEGAAGPRVSVVDLATNTVLTQTDDLREAAAWRAESHEFQTSAATRSVVVKVLVSPAGTEFRGDFWLDSMQLRESETKVAKR
jgi:tetratricopeptide (TPR) repeat protein